VSAVTRASLTATTRPLPPGTWATHPVRLDPDVLFERDGRGLAGRGCALRIDSGIVEQVLASIDCDDELGRPGTGPVAFAALPFDRDATGTFVVPSIVVGRDADGCEWETVIGDTPGERPATPTVEPDAFRLRSPVPHVDWMDAIAEATERLRSGEARKVVLAREVVVEANRPIVVPTVLGRLRALFPSCTTFLVDGFAGASPEVLVRRTGAELVAHPLAGTRPRSGDPDTDHRVADELLASDKDRREHAAVVDALAVALAPFCTVLDVPAVPSIVELRNVLHLGTHIAGTLTEPAPSLLDLGRAIHPTPAVGGHPTDEALAMIADLEPGDRSRYAGPVGWMDARGDGELVVGIRSAQIDGSTATMWAGVGVVDGSDPADELAETQLKLQTMLAAIVRP
jgi:menaquinone-specific isochorismate synthase